MSKIKLKSIVSEIIKEMIDVHPIHQKINNKLMQIARRGFEAEEDEKYVGDADKGNKILDKANPKNVAAILRGEKPMKEGDSDTKTIEITYTVPGNRFYGVKIDGKKLPGFDASNEFIKNLTGLELPTRAWSDDKEVLDIVDALKAKGIEAFSSEQDIS